MFDSLDAKMVLDIVDVAPYNGVVQASGAKLRTLRDDVIPNETVDTDLFAFFSHQNNAGGTVGIAWVGVVCLGDNNKGYRNSINEYFNTDLRSAEVNPITFDNQSSRNLHLYFLVPGRFLPMKLVTI